MRGTLAGGLFLTLIFPTLIWAQPKPVGSEFQVNQYTIFGQRYPSVATDGAGRFVVVWHSANQDPGGAADYGIFGRLFDSAGSPVGGEFQVHTYVTNRQERPAVAMNPSGDFVVVWQSMSQDGSDEGIYCQRFDSSGGKQGGEFLVNSWTTSRQRYPSVGMDDQGNFVVVWSGASYVDSSGVTGQRFDSLANPVGGDFQVNVYINNTQAHPDLAMNGVGDFAVAWHSDGQDGSGYGTFMRWFDTGGTAPVGGFQVNTAGAGWQHSPSVGMDEDGGFVVVWEDYGLNGIFGQRYDSSGTPVGSNFEIYSDPSGAIFPDVAMNDDGEFAVVWTHHTDGDSHGIFGRFFDRSGLALGPEFQVNTWTTSRQRTPSVAMDDSGDFVVVWTSVNQDYPGFGTFGKRFEAPSFEITDPNDHDTLDCSDPRVSRPTITWDPSRYDRFRVFLGADTTFRKRVRVTSGDTMLKSPAWTPGRKKWRKACNKAISENPFNPVLYIRVLGKDRDLPKKDPARKGYTPVVEVDISQ